MNRRQLIRTLALTTLAASASHATAAGKKTEDALKVGETLRYDSELELTFLAVRKDRRCPINAACLTQGDAVVVLRVKAGNQAPRNVRIHTDLKPRKVVIPANKFPEGMAGIPKSYVISIARLNPLPTGRRITPQSDYRLKLRITVAQ
jgi:sRNA-binding carbon storage regulator CsrA